MKNLQYKINKNRHYERSESIFIKVPTRLNEITCLQNRSSKQASFLVMTFQKLFSLRGYACTLLLLISFTTLISCKDDDSGAEPTALDLQLTALQNGGSNWVPSSSGILKDGFDVSDQFQNFTLNFGSFTFSTNNSLSGAWPASGTWEFVNDNPNQLMRSDGVQMTATVSSNVLTLTFMGLGSEGGRMESVDGEYQFRLVSE